MISKKALERPETGKRYPTTTLWFPVKFEGHLKRIKRVFRVGAASLETPFYVDFWCLGKGGRYA
jgi:hypothetical protein